MCLHVWAELPLGSRRARSLNLLPIYLPHLCVCMYLWNRYRAPIALKCKLLFKFISRYSTTVLNFKIKSSYSDGPGTGYQFLETTRLVEPHVHTTFTVEDKLSMGISSCKYRSNLRYGGGPWSEIKGVQSSDDWHVSASFSTELHSAHCTKAHGISVLNLTCPTVNHHSRFREVPSTQRMP